MTLQSVHYPEVPHPQIQPTTDSVVQWHILTEKKKKSPCKWTHVVQTHIVQGSTVMIQAKTGKILIY